LSNLVASYGLLGVFVLMVGESCGLPLPSEVIMPTAGLLAATGHMQGGLIAAIVAGALANLVGSLVAYVLAARFGEPLLLGPGRYVGIRRRHLEMADGWFRRWGLLAVFIGRVLPVIRTYISFPAGLARIDLAKFSALTLIGALPWCAALALGAEVDHEVTVWRVRVHACEGPRHPAGQAPQVLRGHSTQGIDVGLIDRAADPIGVGELALVMATDFRRPSVQRRNSVHVA